ncbi:hypothetical protein HPB47_002991 [Ixodes persulcatus]|uniref:Uncharacterized protein n=1 Tax=Ixodes persulcatus TaxID=34615 RepID=A0AC60PJV5_IXOPE|nr:hypothetical protein HPB47_002991 [Ixodes persulcatus]
MEHAVFRAGRASDAGPGCITRWLPAALAREARRIRAIADDGSTTPCGVMFEESDSVVEKLIEGIRGRPSMECHNVPRADAGLPAISAATVGAYTVHLPPFWAQHPEVWFLQVEGSFRLAKITSQEVRFSHVQASLPCEGALEVYDILARPSATNPVRCAQDCHFRTHNAFGTQTPAAVSLSGRTGRQRQMQALLGDRAATFNSQFLKELFLQHLPPSVQMVLATASELSFPALALHAYKIMEVASQPPSTSTVSSVKRPEPATPANRAPAAAAVTRD